MYILRIEHPIPDFDGWKKAFDSDPVSREKSGVRRYQILRPVDDAKYVMIDLEFDTVSQAEALLAALRVTWGRVEGTIMMNPQARIVEAVETKEYLFSSFLPFALIMVVTSLGVFVFLRQKQANRAGSIDNNAWLLILLLIVAILSIGCFIAFIFLRGSVG